MTSDMWDLCLSEFLLDSFPQVLKLLDPVLLPVLRVTGGQRRGQGELGWRQGGGRRGVAHNYRALPLGGDTDHRVTGVLRDIAGALGV